MKNFLMVTFLFLSQIQGLEYEVQFENDQICISRIMIAPKEEIGLHRDALQKIVIGMQGGVITRIESDGREVDVEFPTGKSVYRPIDPEGALHRSLNKSDFPIEIIVIEMKK